MEDFKNLFERLKENNLLNTSYPLYMKDWDAFRVHEGLSFDDELNMLCMYNAVQRIPGIYHSSGYDTFAKDW